MEKTENVVVDIDRLTQSSERCSGSPKMTKALSRKTSSRMEKRTGEDLEGDEETKRTTIKVVCSQMEQTLILSKALSTPTPCANTCSLLDVNDGRVKKIIAINPRRILLLFASVSSFGTLVLIYFTLAIYRQGKA